MGRTGVMGEIRRRLTDGETAKKLIAEGFKSGSVYKVRWELDKQGLLPTNEGEIETEKHEHSDDDASSHDRGDGPDLSGLWALVHGSSKPEPEPIIRGDLRVYQTELPFPRVLFHPESPVPCPSCGAKVPHWEWCPVCRALFPGECECREDSPEAALSYTFEQLAEAASR
jgi:hypothetical protein